MRLPTGKLFSILLSAIALATAALFFSRQWMPQAASQHATILDRQLHWSLIDSAVLFLAAQFILAGIVWKFRAQTSAATEHPPSSKQTRTFSRGVTAAISIGVLFIAVELFSAATLGRSAWAAMYDSPGGSDVRVQAMGQQFAFYFRYPGPDGKFGPIHVDKIDASIGNYFGLDRSKDPASHDDVVDAALVLPVNRPAEILLLAQDVIHGFYVRELRIQQDMVPGMEIPVHFTPTRIGKYEIVCSQLCGLGHYRMRAYLQVVSQADFDTWMRIHAK